MSALPPHTAHLRGRIAGLTRAVRNGERGPDDPELLEAKQAFYTARISDYVNRILAEAPPLTDNQRAQLAELLAPAPRNGGAANA